MIEPAADLATGKFGMQHRNETDLSAEAFSLKALRAARVEARKLLSGFPVNP
jgi:hypothetical protein